MRIVVGFAPGGPNDINARLIGQWLSERLGQQFIVDNRPGASGNIAMESVVKSPPDGYTLVMAATSSAANATLYDNLPFNFLRDIAPVGGISGTYYALLAHPSVPAKTLPARIASFAYQNKAVVYDLLFKASSQAVLTIAADPEHLGVRIGITAVLHTWGSTMTHHSHVHMIVPGGGISLDGSRWLSCQPRFLLPVPVLTKLFQG